MKVGTPKTSESGCDVLVLGPDLLGRPVGVHLGQHRVGIDPAPLQGAPHHRAVAQVAPLGVAGVEQGAVHGEELLGIPVPHHHPGGQGHQVGLLGRILPRRDAALGDVGLVEEERARTSRPRVHRPPGRRGCARGRSGRTGNDSPRSRRRSVGNSWLCNPGWGRSIPCDACPIPSDGAGPRQPVQRNRRPTRPRATPMAAPPRTSEAWWARRCRRLRPTSDALVNKQGVAGTVTPLAHDGDRAEGGQGVTAREAAGGRLTDRHPTGGQRQALWIRP